MNFRCQGAEYAPPKVSHPTTPADAAAIVFGRVLGHISAAATMNAMACGSNAASAPAAARPCRDTVTPSHESDSESADESVGWRRPGTPGLAARLTVTRPRRSRSRPLLAGAAAARRLVTLPPGRGTGRARPCKRLQRRGGCRRGGLGDLNVTARRPAGG